MFIFLFLTCNVATDIKLEFSGLSCWFWTLYLLEPRHKNILKLRTFLKKSLNMRYIVHGK